MRALFVLFVAVTGAANVETLPQRSAAEIHTPEGFIRAEGGGAAGSGRGTFGVYPAGAYARPAAPPASPLAAPGEAAPRAPDDAIPKGSADVCRSERNRFLRRLLRMDGIDLEDPLAVLDGLSGPGGYSGAFLFSAYGLLPGVDPVRPLAWDLELRSLARELAACAAAARAAPR